METALAPCPEGTIFALDIGTRSITGIVAHLDGDRLCVDACETLEHTSRPMVDGQIENIGQVALVAGLVKKKLEETVGHTLTKVSVAAAGRALKTCRAKAEASLPPADPITAQRIYELESSAVNEARSSLVSDDGDLRYYCVAYSVVRYLLDGYPFSSVVGHCASRVEVELIATFLPTEVVGSLQRCMELLDLEIDTFTLEPIAAMRAVIPPDVRLLNLALVDIGAGTSDIALSRDGAASGFTMVTTAGDEITEAVIKRYLVNFETAERIKTSLNAGGDIAYHDILGHERATPAADILASIDTAVELLAKEVADRLYECNGGSPAAVFLVGGGSRTPGVAQKLAAKLTLDEDRVALGSTHFRDTVSVADPAIDLDGPEYATPLGIAQVAADHFSQGGAFVRINGRKVRLFAGYTPSVMDALLMSGYRYSDLMGRNGRTLTFALNGERKTLRGGGYTVAEISLNGKPASLTSPVVNGDALEIEPATSGADAGATVAEAANMAGAPCSYTAFVNGTAAEAAYKIVEFDDVEIVWADEPAVENGGNTAETGDEHAQSMAADTGAPADAGSAPPTPGFTAAGAGAEEEPEQETETEQGAPEGEPGGPVFPAPPAAGLSITLNRRALVLPPKLGGEPYSLIDLFPLVDIDPAASGGNVSILCNGETGAAAELLKSGDAIEIIVDAPSMAER